MKEYIYNLTEEIARWSFEVSCKTNKDWYIAFSNPTAGPWKSIKAMDKLGNEGNIYTFDAQENRPDIVLVNDKLRIIIIIEAKADYSDLLNEAQMKKSVKVVADLSKMLQKMRDDQYWGKRYMYKIYVGLLWGTSTPLHSAEKKELFDLYHSEILGLNNIDKRLILGIEVLKDDNGLRCFLCGENYEINEATISIQELADSLLLEAI